MINKLIFTSENRILTGADYTPSPKKIHEEIKNNLISRKKKMS